MNYYATGETAYGEDVYTDSGFDGQSLEAFTEECSQLLNELDGGHLDIFNENDEFVRDVEV